MAKPTLLLFDIDGTLVLTGGAGMRAMNRALSHVFGIGDGFRGIAAAGRTDSELLARALAQAGLPGTPDAHERFRAAYLPRLAEEIVHPGTGRKGVMPGVRPLLEALATQPLAHVALLTGNYRGAAEIKLAHFSLWHFFEWGAFGEEAEDRRDLGRIALGRAREQAVPSEACVNVVIVGDTPQDVATARAIGARAVAVATGPHSAAELQAAGADEVLDDLHDTERALTLLL
jgi:phosphoglycolate phosphatase-like HAD superfamily hydrolase